MSDVSTPEQPAGFQVRHRFYPIPAHSKIGDPRIVLDLTGLSWETFQTALGVEPPDGEPDTDDRPSDELVLAGLLGMAIHHAHPSWDHHKTVRFVASLDETEVEVLGLDADADEIAEPDAPLEAPSPTGEATPDATPEQSSPPPDSSSSDTTPASSGPPTSDTSSPA